MAQSSRGSVAPDGMPNGIADELRVIGSRIEVERTQALYAPLHDEASYGGIVVHRDLPYGAHERQVADVFSPENSTAERLPVLVFVHGGGFVRGAKRVPGTPFYDNVMLWAVARSLVGVNVNYRLAPEYTWPSGIDDLRYVMTFIDANIEAHGGDAARVFLWGHSAGAAHVADYIAAQTRAGRPTGITGAILTSGFYELGDEVSSWQVYYGDDVSRYDERSSLAGLVAAQTPLFIADAELDPPHFGEQARLLADSLAAAGRTFRYLHLPGHSHISETYAVGTEDRSLTDPVLAFIRACSG